MKLTIPSEKYNKWTAFHDKIVNAVFTGIKTEFDGKNYFHGSYTTNTSR